MRNRSIYKHPFHNFPFISSHGSRGISFQLETYSYFVKLLNSRNVKKNTSYHSYVKEIRRLMKSLSNTFY